MEHNNTYTTKSKHEKIKSPLKRKFVFGFIFIIVPILGLLFAWLGFRIADQSKQETLEKARVIADQIVLTRQWITDAMGGVYVNVKSPGAKGVTPATNDKITTSSDTYQLFTPSMVTQKLSQYSFEKKEYQFRLSSLTPINSANQANRFEAEALNRFRLYSNEEYYQFTDTSFDYMIPLYNTRGCTKCHTNETKEKKSIIGGLRVSLPYGNIRNTVTKNVLLLAGAGIGITLATILMLLFFIHTLILKPLNAFEEKSRLLSSGDLSARVTIDTGDELQRLGHIFNRMASSLSRNRDDLEEKIAKATVDLARANHELLKLDKLKSDFLANMSHELRTPLTSVKGSINYLERTVKDKEQLAFIQIIEKNISRLTRLIANLFDFTRLEAGAIEWEFCDEDISGLVRDVVEISTPLASQKQINIRLDAPDRLNAVIDFERMEQVLVNLIDNAVKFSEPGTFINISVTDNQNHIVIMIQDQGKGIPKENLESVFRKFYTSTSNPDGRNHGAGMGLAISKAIVTAHKGTIEVKSREGEGACFTITLPKDGTQTEQEKQ